jgi:prepilin-type N-terminal cleavage/methylation domain-containing protein
MKLPVVQVDFFRRSARSTNQGFTLTEVLVVIIIAGVLAGIAAPSWLTFVDRQRVTTVRNELLLKMKEAQAKALRTKTKQSIEIENPTPGAARPIVFLAQKMEDNTYRRDEGSKKILGAGDNSSFRLETIVATGQPSELTFNYDGTVESPKNKINPALEGSPFIIYRIKPRENSTLVSCITVDTLIGAIREASDAQCQ